MHIRNVLSIPESLRPDEIEKFKISEPMKTFGKAKFKMNINGMTSISETVL